jgi:hypothetical protein
VVRAVTPRLTCSACSVQFVYTVLLVYTVCNLAQHQHYFHLEFTLGCKLSRQGWPAAPAACNLYIQLYLYTLFICICHLQSCAAWAPLLMLHFVQTKAQFLNAYTVLFVFAICNLARMRTTTHATLNANKSTSTSVCHTVCKQKEKHCCMLHFVQTKAQALLYATANKECRLSCSSCGCLITK